MAIAVRPPIDESIFLDADGRMVGTSQSESANWLEAINPSTGSSAQVSDPLRTTAFALWNDFRVEGCELSDVSSESDLYRIRFRCPNLISDEFVRFENTASSFLSVFAEAALLSCGGSEFGATGEAAELEGTVQEERLSLRDAGRLAVRILCEAEAERLEAAAAEALVGIQWEEEE